jgi:hypothetical protein
MGEGDGVLDLGQDRGQVHGLGGHYVCERRRIGCGCCCWSKGHIGEVCVLSKSTQSNLSSEQPHDLYHTISSGG